MRLYDQLQEPYLKQQSIRLLHEISAFSLSAQFKLLAGALAEQNKAGFKPDQLRVPAGQPDGGQWTREGGGGNSTEVEDTPYEPIYQGAPDLPLEPVYPIEEALALFSGLEMLVALRTLVAGRAAINASSRKIQSAAKAIEDWLGGPGEHIWNKVDDMVLMRGDKKVRFDIKGAGKDKPHFHLEVKKSKKDWEDAGLQHRYYFKED